jgi:uncharacterized protein involved in exopolysaccharide biosynthesis
MHNFTDPGGQSIGAFTFVRLHRGKIILSFLLGIALTLAYLSLAPRTYQSEAKLFVRMGRESVSLDPTVTTSPFVGMPDTRESEVFAVEELLTSRSLADKIVDQFGPEVILERDPTKPCLCLGERLSWLNGWNLNPFRVYSLHDKAVKAFQENLRVSSASKTSVVSLSYSSENPRLAQDVLKALLATTCEEHMRVHRTRGSQEFFQAQSALQQSNLSKLEEQFRVLKNKMGVASLSTQRDIQLQQLGALQTDLLRARSELSSLQAESSRRRQHMAEEPILTVGEQRTGQPHSTDQALQQRLHDLEISNEDLASKFAPEHPARVAVASQLAEARRLLKSEKFSVDVKTTLNPAHQAAELSLQEQEGRLSALTAKIASLEEQIATAQQGLQQLNDAEVEINRLEREIDLARFNCRKHAENLEQTRINQELEQAKISSLNSMQPPTFSETPISPRPLATLAVGIVGALFLGLGVALGAQQFTGQAPADSAPPQHRSPAASIRQRSLGIWRTPHGPAKMHRRTNGKVKIDA